MYKEHILRNVDDRITFFKSSKLNMYDKYVILSLIYAQHNIYNIQGKINKKTITSMENYIIQKLDYCEYDIQSMYNDHVKRRNTLHQQALFDYKYKLLK
jgi:hypothetical protein